MREKGFSLVEVVVAAVIIAILASITIPAILKARRRTEESAAIAILRIINNRQFDFKSETLVDQDDDDLGEYGLLGELTCSVTIRGQSTNPDKTFISHKLAPEANKSYGIKDRYCFKIYLPGSSSVVTDDGTNNPTSISSNANYQEHRYRCYAWPSSPESFGVLAFATDHNSNLYKADNIDSNGEYRYAGDINSPAYNAASPGGDTYQFTKQLEGGGGNDGQTWYIVTK